MKRWLYIVAIAIAGVSCNMVRGLSDTTAQLLHGEVVARAGDHRLHRSELERFIPAGVSPEDSAGLAARYIKAWAEELLMLDMAQEQLSKEQKDVSAELEEYRRSLLKYRYEQLYINQRLDTLVTEEEIADYYNANQDKFKLDRPVIKSRYLIIPADSRSLKAIRKAMSSEDDTDALQADSLAFTSAIKYVDSSDSWMDAITLAQELGTDYRSLVSSIKNSFSEFTDDAGNLHLAYIVEMVPAGKTAPLEYISERIKDIILSARKHSLETALEQDILEDAIQSNKFVVYSK
ncbi:MAG: peptidyl-prolyl cis-trans isomerase [Bacteroidales bacterium]|nr:peptidyl-prolyl cis-trans isomerase [Bacteroidales bacterium]MBO4585174.1 peptidyl-prolyl cis-trans isomerase [Bacteroidales bacterium]